MREDRFNKLEIGSEEGPTSSQKQTLPNRFKHLEIGEVILTEKRIPQAAGKILCPGCGEANESQREICWRCFSPLYRKPSPSSTPHGKERLTLVLDGKEYHSDAPDLPEDISVLMRRIQEEGYSQELAAQWRQWRATRNQRPPGKTVSVHQMSRVTVIKVDGKTYTSSDENLPADIRVLMERVQREGMTEELQRELQGHGGNVKQHPPQTQQALRAGGGDPEFWKEISRRLERESGFDWENFFRQVGPALVIVLGIIIWFLFFFIRSCSAMRVFSELGP